MYAHLHLTAGRAGDRLAIIGAENDEEDEKSIHIACV